VKTNVLIPEALSLCDIFSVVLRQGQFSCRLEIPSAFSKHTPGLKALRFRAERCRGFENPLPRTQSPGLAPIRSWGTKTRDDLGHVRAFARTIQGRPGLLLLEFLVTEYAHVSAHQRGTDGAV
jgi:hypothetical protein